MPEQPLNPTAASLLGFLGNGSMTGWEVFERCSSTIGAFWNVTRSQVYRELNDLARRGMVDQGEPGPRGRTPFTITDLGRHRFEVWLESPPAPDIIRSPLLLTVFFGRQLPAERLRAMVADEREHHQSLLERYEALHAALAGAGEPFIAATVDFGVRHERAYVEWLDAVAEITS